MKKIYKTNLFLFLFIILISIFFTSCKKNSLVTVKCSNGSFIGSYEKGFDVISFKGIPYAKAPRGDLRWKKTVAAEDSDHVYYATEYGKSSIQYYWFSESITTAVGEDCLSLNIWTNDLNDKNKAVMVFFHGGAFGWGGSSEPLYDGQYIVKEHKDVIVVTVNYRVGITGFANFSNVEGGEEYADSVNLGLYDCIEALKWIQKNIASFGGDPNCVTIFGESAGAGIVTSLITTEYAGTLFKRVISESGAVNQTLTTDQSYYHTSAVDALIQLSGAKNMNDLIEISEEKLIEYNETTLDEDENCLNDFHSIPVRGTDLLPLDMYGAYLKKEAQSVDLLIGSNLDEMKYWIAEMGDKPLKDCSEEEIAQNQYIYEHYFIQPMYEGLSEKLKPEELKRLEDYLALYEDTNVDAISRLLGDLYFRSPSIKLAENHAMNNTTGSTYMYLFEKENPDFSFVGSGHASELAYVFLNYEETDFCGEVNKYLAKQICACWVNFAKTGNPSTSEVTWNQYDSINRSTMIFGNDNTLKMVNDPYKQERELLAPLMDYYLIMTGA